MSYVSISETTLTCAYTSWSQTYGSDIELLVHQVSLIYCFIKI